MFKEITFNRLNYFDPNDPKKISDKIISILKNKNKQQNLINLTSRVSKHYSSRKIVNEFSKLFV